MTFQEAVRACLSKYATFSGRASRSEYWNFYLFNFILCFGLMMISIPTTVGIVFSFNANLVSPKIAYVALRSIMLLPLLLYLGFACPFLAAHVRRLHDVGRSGWWLLIFFIPFVGLLLLLYWSAQPSDPRANAYGEVPIGASS